MSGTTNSLRRGVVILADMAKFYGEDRLKSLEDRCHFSYVQPTSREAIISQLRKLASERQYEVMMFFPGFWNFLPWDQDFFGPFAADLKLITGTGAGYDHINMDYLNQIGACYANSPVAVAEPTATAAVMLILQTVRATTQAEMTLRRGKWREGIELTDDIRDMTIGIIGNGRIGQLVQKKMQALGAGKILYNNRNRLPPSDENGAIYKPLDELLSQSDLITLHCPYTPETKHLISDEQFAKMKKGSYVVNTSRGAVIDEKALVRAMESEKIAGVGLDVFENEPEVHPYLMKSERATLLPHCGSSVKRAIHDVHIESINNLEKWLDTGVPNTPVNKPFPKLKN